MTTTKNKYHNPSVNIIRDLDREIKYIPTTNSQLVYDEIINHYKKGTRSFTIVGAYGTGKSSFLWAFEKTINRKNQYFSNPTQINPIEFYEIFSFVGDYKSITSSFAEYLGMEENISSVNILKELDKTYKALRKQDKGLAIIIDEFGKFLEYAAKNLPESELYFIQQLAEYANDIDKEIYLITTLHQGFNSYASQLTKCQKQEWDKVSGRFVELAFNEPVEQLLILAAEKLNSPVNKIDEGLSNLFDLIINTKTFPLKNKLDLEICRQILPFDLISAGVLTISLQRYGQNQRSLFSFIDSGSHLSINDYDNKSNPYFNLACVYDYLNFNYYSYLFTRSNPDYFQWASINNTLERCESIFPNEFSEIQKIIKSIGLLSFFSNKGAIVNDDFLENYSRICLGVANSKKLIKQLDTNNLIRFSKYNNQYKLTEGTDLNIELAIDAAGNLIQQVSNVVSLLEKHFDLPYIIAKEAFYETGTPRFFEFILSEAPQNIIPEGEIDGFINLIFSETLTDIDLEIHSKSTQEAILYCVYKNTSAIKALLFDIEKVIKVIDDNKDDKIAVKELNAILEHHKTLLNHYIFENLFDHNQVSWFFNGSKLIINNSKELNRVLSNISNKIYSGTPIMRNELFNRTKVSSNISTARKSYVSKLIEKSEIKDLGFDDDLFPPEKTIYLSLLKKTGIHQLINDKYTLTEPIDPSFSALWETDIKFIESSKTGRRKLSELITIYQCRPLKLKQGFIDFWLPIFLVIHKGQFALYGDGVYIPDLSADNIDLILKKPENYEVKAFDLDNNKLNIFNRYRLFLNQIEENQPTNQTFIETIKPFLVFYRSLPQYTIQTQKLSKKAIALRESLAQATDAEKAFFEELPRALGYSLNDFIKSDTNLEEYIIQLRDCIQEINNAYDNLLNRFESHIISKLSNKQLSFIEYKNVLTERFSKIKKHLISAKQKTLLLRIKSPIEERKSWLTSIAFAIVGKSLEQITDQEEKVLKELFVENIRELDNLCEISKSDVDSDKEDVFKIEITSFVKGLEKRLVRLPKQDKGKISTLEHELRLKLEQNNKDLNIAVLTQLLQEQLKNE